MKLLIVYNPYAGNGRALKLLPQIRAYLDLVELDYQLVLSEYPKHTLELVSNAALEQYSGVIASGGDGTLFEVLNGYKNNPLVKSGEITLPLGLIPNGTGNAFMKELGLKKSDWRKAIDIICSKNTQCLDIGMFSCEQKQHFFINIVGMGFVSQVAQAATPLKWLGNSAYTIATLLKLINLKPQTYELELDGVKQTRQGIFVEVANSRYTGTKFLMAPNASLQDGKLDVVLLNTISRLRLLRLFSSIYDGSHINFPEVETLQVSAIKVIEEKPSHLVADGEILNKTPAHFACLPKAVDFFWPS
ncbi:diacylglycerol/lipid kinase family protein [Aliikangiella sp. IMCC44632]